jgi:RHS repeat-associated protein
MSALARTLEREAHALAANDNCFKSRRWTRTKYTYDANGNRTSVTDPSSNVTNYNYPGTSNQLQSLSGYVAETLSYDAAGNETGDGTNTYAYNARGRMSTVTVGSTTTTYGVNGLGERVTKSGTGVGGGGTNEYMYDEQGHLLGEYNSTGARIEETIWLNDSPAVVMTGTGTPTFYALSPDWQNVPHVIANSSGTFAWTWDRLDFGNNAPNQNPGGLGTFVYNPRFPGQLSDVESGLSNNMARDYNPVFGRYVQSDPIGLGGGVNTYGYVGANPLKYTDALGLGPQGEKYNYCTTTKSGTACGYLPSNSVTHSSVSSAGGSNPTQVGDGDPIQYAPNNGTITCTGPATYTAVGGNQAMGNGALYSQYPAEAGGSIQGGTFGTVAVQNGFLGLTTAQLRAYGTQISVTPSNQFLIGWYGGPTGSLSVSDYGDRYIQATPGVAFDIYRFPSVPAGRQFGSRTMGTTISFPAASGGSCPTGYTGWP